MSRYINYEKRGDASIMKSTDCSLMECFVRAYHNETSAINVIRSEKSRAMLTNEEYSRIAESIAPDCDRNSLRHAVYQTYAPRILAADAFNEDAALTAFTLGCKQYISLAPGLDSFAVRYMSPFQSVRLFELDTPENIDNKKKRLTRAGIDSSLINFVECDSDFNSVCEALGDTPFEKTKPVFFSLIGLTHRLNRKQIYSVFEQIALLSCEGSSLLFDYITPDFDSVNTEDEAAFSQNEIKHILSSLGYRIYEHSDGVQTGRRFFSLFNRFNPDCPLILKKQCCFCLAVKKC